MFTTLKDFQKLWDEEAGMTAKIFAALTDASLSQAINNDHRTIGRIAWHIAQTTTEMLGQLGLSLKGPGEHEAVPSSAKAIATAYDAGARSMGPAIAAAKWTDAELATKRPMYGEEWTVEATLRAALFHQAHHRGQLTVLMRQAGLRVPGLYGPAKEDWSKMGMEAPAI